MRNVRGVAAMAAVTVLVAAGCGSSSKSGSPSQSATTQSTSGSGATPSPGDPQGGIPAAKTYTIGVMGDLTGAASADSQDMKFAVEAGIGVAASEGYKIKYDLADTQSTPAGALTAAKTLVEQDHAFAVVAISDLTFGAAAYLASKQIPVIGAAVDGTEWTTDRNMFSIFGTPDYTKVTTTPGQFFKLVGATNVGSLGYGVVPSAAEYAKGVAISSEAAGLKAGYVNSQFPLGSTNVGPVVLAMKSAGIDGLAMEVEQNTSFAIVTSLKNEGVDLKAPVYAAGYGSDLIEAGPGAEQVAQNGYFSIAYEPVEMKTPATEKFQNALKTYASYTKAPGLNDYLAYISVDAIVDGLKAAGPDPTQGTFINAMLGLSNYNAAGLWGSHTINFAMDARGQGGPGADNCAWFTTFKGTTFHLVPGADPICGTAIPGKTVSAS